GEVALLCDINPVTLRAWQRRYGLLKPQRTDGGHRLFNDADIDTLKEKCGDIVDSLKKTISAIDALFQQPLDLQTLAGLPKALAA
ncbi:MerR family DNA-binding transcriptional regulator, partial [Salmonella enterica subsp. enterica serovar Kentucky]|nr:MerR family DNA-binding transcriptional regulator [Salmonella enterica subsp. enterica serovar Kentucky]